MGEVLDKLETELKGLSVKEKAELAYFLIEELDGEMDPSAEEAWRMESERRLEAYRAGQIDSVPVETVFARARSKLKK